MTADEMLEKLGYIKREEDVYKTYYEKEINTPLSYRYLKGITFALDIQRIEVFTQDITPDSSYGSITTSITTDELQAINQKCKELGWLK